MVSEHSPYIVRHARTRSVTDPSLLVKDLPRYIETFVLACKVEGKSKRTIASYRQRLKCFVNEMSSETGLVHNHEVRLFLLKQQEKGSDASTVNVYYRVIRTFMNWLLAEDIIQGDPMANVKPPKVPLKKPKPFTPQDIDNLLTAASGHRFVDVRNTAMLLVYMDTALRLEENCNIKQTDIDFERETILVMGKGGKERIVRVGRNTQKAILRYLLMREDELPALWLNENRQPITYEGFKLAMRKLCKRAHVSVKPGAHTMRHTAALRFLRNGGDPFVLQIMMGHSTLAMTRRYVSTLGDDDVISKHRAASPVDNWFKSGGK